MGVSAKIGEHSINFDKMKSNNGENGKYENYYNYYNMQFVVVGYGKLETVVQLNLLKNTFTMKW